MCFSFFMTEEEIKEVEETEKLVEELDEEEAAKE
jgi:hypothetical protein